MNKKGFMMSETIIVVTVLTVFSLSLYVFTSSNIKKYESRDKYNTLSTLYNANNIKTYLIRWDKFNALVEKINSNTLSASKKYIDITNSYTDDFYYVTLKLEMNIKNIIFCTNNIESIKEELINDDNYDEYFKNFIKSLTNENDYSGVRLIVSYNDNTFGTIKINDKI